MNEVESRKQIETRLVYGFLDAGKTTYIQSCVKDDRFFKYGSTLILCFECGLSKYDEAILEEKKASVEYYKGGDIKAFCMDKIRQYQPDRIYVEMNTMITGLKDQFPECLKVTFTVTMIDWATMSVYYVNLLQMLKSMVSESHQITFRGCPSCELLEPYSQSFRLMNPEAVYLRQDPMGYHEKAFGLFMPFSLEDEEITINENSFLPFWLDALDHPEHYNGKTLHFTDPLEIRKSASNGLWTCGRVVMTCCMADLQFMSVELEDNKQRNNETACSCEPSEGWAVIAGVATTVFGNYAEKKLRIIPQTIHHTKAPDKLILDSRYQ